MGRVALLLLCLAADSLASSPPRAPIPSYFTGSPDAGWRAHHSEVPVHATAAGVRIGPFHIELIAARKVVPLGDSAYGVFRRYSQGAESKTTAYQSLTYPDIYPGVSMRLSLDGSKLKSEFIVAPGASPSPIRIRYRGAARLRTRAGDLVVEARSGDSIVERRPEVYQFVNGRPQVIRSSYEILGRREVRFRLGEYDRTLPLIIDPYISGSLSYYGGSGIDSITSVAADSTGIYLAGWTESVDFPAAPLRPRRAGVEAFICKTNPGGTQLLWATYLGGSLDDRAIALKVNESGQVLVGGWTTSLDFPVVAGTQANPGGGRDGWVARLTSSGGLLSATYLGGSGADAVNAVTWGASGEAIVAGETASANFPLLSAFQPANAGATDAFVTRYSTLGSLLSSTYVGGASIDQAFTVISDSTGAIYVGGGTYSSNFPRVGGWQPYRGGQDGFVAKFNPGVQSLAFSSFLGGSEREVVGLPEKVLALGFASDQTLIAAGVTCAFDFPVVQQLYGVYRGGAADGFVAKIAASGSALQVSTYLGGSSSDEVTSITTASDGSVYLGGTTASPDFPLPGSFQSTMGGETDLWLARLNAGLTAQLFGSYFGTPAAESMAGVLVSGTTLTVAGDTSSPAGPNSELTNGFVAQFSETPLPVQVTSSVPGWLFSVAGAGCSPGAYTTPITVLWWAGAQCSVSFTSSQAASTQRNVFTQWADLSTANPRTFHALPTLTSLSIGTRTEYPLTRLVSPAGAGSVQSVPGPSDFFHSAGSAVQLTATASPGFTFSGWSGAVSGQTNPQPVVMNAAKTVTANFTCSFSLSPLPGAVGASGGSPVVTVSTGIGCDWPASSPVSWISPSVTIGTGTGSVTLAVTANPGTVARTAVVAIAGQPVTITQAGIACSYTVSPSWTSAVSSDAATLTVAVTAPALCAWTTSGGAAWVSVSAGGTGSGTVQVQISDNPSVSTRSAQITVAGVSVMVQQSGKAYCPVSLSTNSLSPGWQGLTSTIQITAAAGCVWSATSDAPWAQVYPLTGTGNGVLQVTMFPNFGTRVRSASLRVNAATTTISEGANPGTHNQRFAGMMYFNFFGRLASAEEIAFQAGVLDRGTPYADLVMAFFGVPEFNSGGRFIAGLYVGLLNRDAEYSGWLFQRNALARGIVNQTDLVRNFIGSDEFRLLFGNPADEEYVRILYRYILLREPGEVEVNFQAGHLKKGLSRVQLATNFLNSNEFKAGTGPRLTVFLLYSCILLRDGKPDEIQTGRAAISDQASVRRMAESLLSSAEFVEVLR